MKINPKNPLTLKIFASIESRSPSYTSRGIPWRIDDGKRGIKRNCWGGQLCLEYSSHDLQQDDFSQSWLVEIAPLNLCKLQYKPPLVWLKTASVLSKKIQVTLYLEIDHFESSTYELNNIVHLTKKEKSVSALCINFLPNNVAPLGIFSLLKISRKKKIQFDA